MKKILLLIIALGVLMTACSEKEQTDTTADSQNPFFTKWETPHGTPPFDKIETSHYKPAFDKAIKEKRMEIKSIAENSDEPTFKNTIEALEYSGALLKKVNGVFGNLTSALTNDTLQEINKEIAPKLSKLNDDIFMNQALFARIKALHDKIGELELTDVQKRILKDYYKDFVRGGANLPEDKKQRFSEINEKLSTLTLEFGENVLKETNKFEMVIDNEEDLAGLPESVKKAARETAESKGYEGKWVFTIQKTSMLPFLTYSEKRELREKLHKAYINKGNHGGELDNKKIASEIAALRVERANLLGFDNHAQYVLEENMAKNPMNVYLHLNEIWEPALAQAKVERDALQKLINEEGGDFELKHWDWWYYAEKLRKQKYDLDEEELRPYFQLENVRNGAFELANKLWGITMEERNDIPVYHEDVTAFEVKDADGSHIGILYMDFFPRESKRGGAWMNSYRKQYIDQNGENVSPVITNVCNFSKPTGDKPALLSFDEVQTLFHEFGHALHGLLSECRYPSVSGTSVARDFVELPSQIMENWTTEPEMLNIYAKHYETGEPMPEELVTKLDKASKFNQGFITTEHIAAAILDMDWHTLETTEQKDAMEFEEKSLNDMGLIDEIVVRYRTPYFRHVFAGGYSSGYYSYSWAGVLDADAFQAFKENGIFDKETASKFRKYVLASGGQKDAMVLYKNFRGQEPSRDPFLERKGLK